MQEDFSSGSLLEMMQPQVRSESRREERAHHSWTVRLLPAWLVAGAVCE